MTTDDIKHVAVLAAQGDVKKSDCEEVLARPPTLFTSSHLCRCFSIICLFIRLFYRRPAAAVPLSSLSHFCTNGRRLSISPARLTDQGPVLGVPGHTSVPIFDSVSLLCSPERPAVSAQCDSALQVRSNKSHEGLRLRRGSASASPHRHCAGRSKKRRCDELQNSPFTAEKGNQMRVWVWGPQVSEQVGERGRGRRTGGERALTSGPN
ncbi:unnamed protein product [Leuciscus chuanchicus]